MAHWLVVVVVVAGCGKVNPIVDAGTADDVIVADDASEPEIVTAISVQSITPFQAAAGAFAKVPYLTERYDDENEFDPATARFTPKAAGDYLVCAGLVGPPVVGAGPTSFHLDLHISGARHSSFAWGEGTPRGCRVARLAAGDFLEVWVGHNSINAVDFVDNSAHDWLMISRLPSPSVAAATSATFTVPPGTFVKVPYAAEARDELSAFNPTTSTFMAANAGDYFICSSLGLYGTYAGEIDLFENGTRVVGFGHNNGTVQGCRTMRVAANATIEVKTSHTSTVERMIPHSALWNWYTVHQVPARVQLNTTSAFTSPANVFTKIQYTSEAFDPMGEFDNGTFTAGEAGDYLFCASFDDGTTTNSEIHAFKNNVHVMSVARGRGAHTGCAVLRLALGDMVDMRTFNQSGSAATITPNTTWHWLQISKVK